MSEPVSDLPAWNIQRAMNCVDGCHEDFRELVQIWWRQSPKLMADMREAMARKDAAGLGMAAHTLKGSLQILSADVACDIVAKLESAGRNGEISGNGTETLLSLAETEIERISEQLRAFLAAGT